MFCYLNIMTDLNIFITRLSFLARFFFWLFPATFLPSQKNGPNLPPFSLDTLKGEPEYFRTVKETQISRKILQGCVQ